MSASQLALQTRLVSPSLTRRLPGPPAGRRDRLPLFSALLAVHVTAAWGQTCDPIDVLVVMDTSGSMASPPERFPRSQAAAAYLVTLLDAPSDRAGLEAFDNVATIVEPLTPDLASISIAIFALPWPAGGTDIAEAVKESTTSCASRRSTVP